MPSRAVFVTTLIGCVLSAVGQTAPFSVVQTSVEVNEFASGATLLLERPVASSSQQLDVQYSTSDGSAVATGRSDSALFLLNTAWITLSWIE